jgi:DNA-binding SARP family transcriptional activator
MTLLAGLLIEQNPLESIRLTQHVLTVDPVWEEAYRVQMQAYLVQGNRPLALRTYQQCVEMLERELGVEPLPETKQLHEQIRQLQESNYPKSVKRPTGRLRTDA